MGGMGEGGEQKNTFKVTLVSTGACQVSLEKPHSEINRKGST